MKRKVNRVGTSTLTVSLPSKWVKKSGLRQGDEVDVVEDGKNLLIVREGQNKKKIRHATLNLDKFNKMMTNRFFHELYRQGAQKITIKFNDPNIADYKKEKYEEKSKWIKKLTERFIGMEIVSQSKDRIICETLIGAEEVSKIDTILQRIYYLVKEFLEELLGAMDSDFDEFHARSYDYHDNISKFTYYYLRLLHFSDMAKEKQTRLAALLIVNDKIMDKIRHTSEQIKKAKKVSPLCSKYIKAIFDQYLHQFDIILKDRFNTADLENIIKKRYALMNKVNREKFSHADMMIISECKILLDTINDFSETYVAKHVDEYVDNA
jgi:phosphate uptake regulator